MPSTEIKITATYLFLLVRDRLPPTGIVAKQFWGNWYSDMYWIDGTDNLKKRNLLLYVQ